MFEFTEVNRRLSVVLVFHVWITWKLKCYIYVALDVLNSIRPYQKLYNKYKKK